MGTNRDTRRDVGSKDKGTERKRLGSEKAIPERWLRYIIFDRSGRALGKDGRLRFHYFLDLLSAAHHANELAHLAKALTEAILNTEGIENIDLIAGPKNGNALLIHAVGAQLGKKTIFYRSSMLFGK